MERVDPVEMGATWRTNDGLVRCGLDAAGTPLAGTPRAANSATVSYLTSPRVQLLSPAAGEATCPVVVQWQAVDPDGLASMLLVTVEMRAVGDEAWTAVAQDIANQGSCVWECSGLEKSADYELRVSARDPGGRVGTATSGELTLR